MSLESVGIIIASIISVVSLIISLKNYYLNKPKLKITLTDKECDAYFGNVCCKDDKIFNSKIAAINLNIINNSPVKVFIKDIKLRIGKDLHRLVDPDNLFWEDIYFFYYNINKDIAWDGSGLNYKSQGFNLPINIKPYSISFGLCLFHDFPKIKAKKKWCEIILYTAIGKITKKIKLFEYNEKYVSAEMKDVKIYLKNCN